MSLVAGAVAAGHHYCSSLVAVAATASFPNLQPPVLTCVGAAATYLRTEIRGNQRRRWHGRFASTSYHGSGSGWSRKASPRPASLSHLSVTTTGGRRTVVRPLLHVLWQHLLQFDYLVSIPLRIISTTLYMLIGAMILSGGSSI
jgi:hypothetical protein